MLSFKIIANQASLSPCARNAIVLGSKHDLSPLFTDVLPDNRVAPITIYNIQYGDIKYGADQNTNKMSPSAQQ